MKKEQKGKKTFQDKGKKTTNSIFTVFLIVLVMSISQSLFRAIFNHSHSLTNKEEVRSKYQDKTDQIFTEIDNKLYEFNTSEEAFNSLSKNANDNKVTSISALMGFLMQAKVLAEFCAPTGYVPQKYINIINSYKNDNIEEELIQCFIEAGANKKQASFALLKTKDVLQKQMKRFLENDYHQTLKSDASYTRSRYCNIYDLYADDIIKDKLNELKRTLPNGYDKYFKKEGAKR